LTQIGDASYGVSKAAAISFAEHMAITHPTIQVHCLCPQAVDTPFVDPTKVTLNSAMSDGLVSAEHVAQCTVKAIEEGNFWVFPHSRVPDYVRRKATDHARWLKGMQRLRKRLQDGNGPMPIITFSKL
jgi:short-subunit dehydrogenase